jgi:hypothetical protein
MNSISPPPLTAAGKKSRVAWLVFLPAALAALALVEPGSFPTWVPFGTSCGAITGLPCIFCGTTRALHHLLHGECERALYYNWLAFPLLLGALGIAVLNTLELALDRNFLACLPRPHFGRTEWSALAVGFVLLWCFQVYLAVSQHKTELLNPQGPLYSLVVR